MYCVFATITDKLGTRSVPTGEGAREVTRAENLLLGRMIKDPETVYYLSWVDSEDAFNAY